MEETNVHGRICRRNLFKEDLLLSRGTMRQEFVCETRVTSVTPWNIDFLTGARQTGLPEHRPTLSNCYPCISTKETWISRDRPSLISIIFHGQFRPLFRSITMAIKHTELDFGDARERRRDFRLDLPSSIGF